ncbi:helix-turn-helix domain-containing protein [Streptomyces peucetius]|uniref:Pyridoxamine 5'-phosphate oxidase family protein n=1 Tax=Streptomyces peucetius TaxID=1950 RepID=A0ABY6I051_STRPE|nr:pyridoxamine 5'-phosphate oxidase family protein [Streptomyces peucetius]UYQ60348.1 pyridoxamine 5'-phosphate oxidase family protein [Streptomyces peucetius]
MPEQPQSRHGSLGPGHPKGDIGRRVATRRQQLGLSREDVALRAGSAPGYIEYIEEKTATPGMGFLLRLADALETTVTELTGGGAELPPGVGMAGDRPELVELGHDQCWALLGTHGVGRVAVTTREGPAILPVNYLVSEGRIAFRTSPGAVPAEAAGTETAFEVDHIDDAFSQGWSVLAVGGARAVTDEEGVSKLERQAYSAPWAGGDRDLWIVLTPDRVTGRRILVRGAPGQDQGPRR